MIMIPIIIMLTMVVACTKQERLPTASPISQIGTKEATSYQPIDMNLSSLREVEVEPPTEELNIPATYLDTLYQDIGSIDEFVDGSIRDGAYARAHALRRWLLSRGIQSDKIFSFGRLTGTSPQYGCCASWFYHVAVVVTVGGTKYVLDPLLYRTPVSVDQWLAGQTVATGCADHPQLRKYMIVAGANYMPVDTLPSSFVTDPSYTHTEWTLANRPLGGGCN